MKNATTNPRVDDFIDKSDKWKKEFILIRSILCELDLIEELKWGVPCYAIKNSNNKVSNVVLIHGFKEYCALLFFKGALLKDPKKILVQQTRNVQAARQIRFVSEKDIISIKQEVVVLLKEAIAIEKLGKKVVLKKTEEYDVPLEFQKKLKEVTGLKIAFNNLTPGRQRAYLLYFSSPKQAKTRVERIEKYLDSILKGKGLHD